MSGQSTPTASSPVKEEESRLSLEHATKLLAQAFQQGMKAAQEAKSPKKTSTKKEEVAYIKTDLKPSSELSIWRIQQIPLRRTVLRPSGHSQFPEGTPAGGPEGLRREDPEGLE